MIIKVLYYYVYVLVWVLVVEILILSLVFVWDGMGLGENGEMWGGEVFCGMLGNWKCVVLLVFMKL